MIRVRRIDVDDPAYEEAIALDTRPGVGVGSEVPASADTEWWVAETLDPDPEALDLDHREPRPWEVIACAGGRVLEHGPYYLSRATVDPAYRGRGIQKRLIRARIARARRLGCPRVVTYTNAANVASGNALIRCGFKLAPPWDGSPNSNGWAHWVRKI